MPQRSSAFSRSCCVIEREAAASSSCSDNARYHHAVILASFLRQHAAHLKLLFLPPYSPQLAPIERVWKLTRRLATHNRYFPALGEVLKAVNACFNRWRRPNAILRRLCCII